MIFLVKNACLFVLYSIYFIYFVLWYEVVSSCYRCWCNNLNEPLDLFPFWVAAE